MKKCRHKGCITILSIYNENKYCFAHLAKELLKEEEREEQKRIEVLQKRGYCYCKAYYISIVCPADSIYTCKDCNI